MRQPALVIAGPDSEIDRFTDGPVQLFALAYGFGFLFLLRDIAADAQKPDRTILGVLQEGPVGLEPDPFAVFSQRFPLTGEILARPDPIKLRAKVLQFRGCI